MSDKTEQDAPYGSVSLPLGELLFDSGDPRDFPTVLDVVACAATLHAPRGFSARLVAHGGGGRLELLANTGRPVPFGLMDALLALVTAEESSEVARWLARIGIPCMSKCPGLTAGAWSGCIRREGHGWGVKLTGSRDALLRSRLTPFEMVNQIAGAVWLARYVSRTCNCMFAAPYRGDFVMLWTMGYADFPELCETGYSVNVVAQVVLEWLSRSGTGQEDLSEYLASQAEVVKASIASPGDIRIA